MQGIPCYHIESISRLLNSIQLEIPRSGRASAPGMLAHRRHELYAAMYQLGGWINDFLATAPSPDEVNAARVELIDPVRAWSRGSPFFQNAYGKPRGYPGDFNTIEIIYRNQPAGDDLPGLILDDCYLHTVATQAVRNRLDFLVEALRAEVRQRPNGGGAPVRILNLGSGPARELALLSRDRDFANGIEVVCVDLDPDALDYARGLIDGRMNDNMTYIHGNVLQFAAAVGRPVRPFDIIYSAGLFDYLDARRAARLIDNLHSLLVSGGKLLIGNFSLETPPNERVMLDWLFEWPLIYRDERNYRDIFARTAFGADCLRFEYEPLRANLFAITA